MAVHKGLRRLTRAAATKRPAKKRRAISPKARSAISGIGKFAGPAARAKLAAKRPRKQAGPGVKKRLKRLARGLGRGFTSRG